MIQASNSIGVASVQGQSRTGNDREQLAEAAQQFEAIFVRQMLAAARKSDFGSDLFASEGLDTFRQMQDENFADIAGKTGTFGLAEMIEQQLARHVPEKAR